MAKETYKSRLIVDGNLVLFGDVGDMWGDGSGFTAKDVLAAVAEIGDREFTVRLNSPGGFVTDGTAIYSILSSHKKPVHVFIEGLAASAGSLIAMAGTDVTMNDAALFMIHDPSGWTVGTAEDHEKTRALLEKMGKMLADAYARKTGASAEEMRQLMLDETWFTADEAKAAGFVDAVTSRADDDAEAVSPTRFNYSLYKNKPDRLDAFQRDLPKAIRQSEFSKEKDSMDEETKAKAAADKLLADAKVAADKLTADAASASADGKAAAKAAADKVIADAQAAADKLVADAKEAKAKADRDAAETFVQAVLARADIAGLSIKDGLAIAKAADGDLVKAQDAIIDFVAKRDGGNDKIRNVDVTADSRDKFVAGVTKALLHRAGYKDGESNEFSGLTLREIARAALESSGVRTVFRDPLAMIAAAMRPTALGGQHSTSDFVQVLANIANKSMLKGWEEAEETFQLWTARGVLVDFKPAKRVDLNLFPALSEVPEGGEYQYGSIGDRGESIVLATYGKMFGITRQAIINDDMNVFTRIPQKMGRAARRTVGNLVYGTLTANANMADNQPLFSVAHDNLAAAGAAPSVVSVSEGRAAMALQKDPDQYAAGGLNIRPSFMLVPVELEGIAKTLMAAQYDPAATAGTLTPNSVAGLATVISDGRLSANSSTAWYLAASPNAFDTIEVAYLNGVDTPTLEQREGWNIDGVEFKVRIDAGVKALDFRGLYKNPGDAGTD